MSTHQSEPAISIRNITKRFGETSACNQLNLEIPHGTTFGLLGPNGAGKSTLIRILMGLVQSDSGTATVLGYDVSQRNPHLREQVGYVPELHYIYRWMTVRQVIRFVSGLYSHWNHSIAACLLDQFELPNDKRVATLSKGMTAKLGLLLALAPEPQLLILDEPTSGLDPIIREEFLESVLQSHTGSDRTVLFSSHHVDDVARVSDQVGIINQGQLVLHGTPEALSTRFKRIDAILDDGRLPQWLPPETVCTKQSRRHWTLSVDRFAPQLVDELKARNAIHQVEISDLCLEEIFKEIVRGCKAKRQEINV